jgi:hypothetical protein
MGGMNAPHCQGHVITGYFFAFARMPWNISSI